jgi:hypothetical protein
MKLVIVTSVEEYKKDILGLFREAKIEQFSDAEIEGFKILSSILIASNWFSAGKIGARSMMFFSFTEEIKIDSLFQLIEKYNSKLDTDNPIKAVVLPIEKHI